MLTYEPGASPAHRLDPRAKLCFQVGFAVAAFASASVPWLAGVWLLSGVALAAARCSPARVVRAYAVVLVVLALAPLVAGATLGPPWLRVGPALDSLRAVARVVPVLFVSAAYVTTTPIRETRAAIQYLLPGRVGQIVGVGVGLVFRLTPLVRADVARVRTAIAARGGDRRSVLDRTRRIALEGLVATLTRSDRLALALRARCFAWNPTLPELRFGPIDYPVLALSACLFAAPLVLAAT